MDIDIKRYWFIYGIVSQVSGDYVREAPHGFYGLFARGFILRDSVSVFLPSIFLWRWSVQQMVSGGTLTRALVECRSQRGTLFVDHCFIGELGAPGQGSTSYHPHGGEVRGNRKSWTQWIVRLWSGDGTLYGSHPYDIITPSLSNYGIAANAWSC